MRHSIRTTTGRLANILGASALLTGGISAFALVSGGPAEAAVCDTGSNCTITGTLTLGGGVLSLTTPDSLTWTGTVTGLDQNLVDTVAADETYLINNATGTTVGWHVTLAATQFTTTGVTPALTLPLAGTFSTNGSVTDVTDTIHPTAACASASTCTLPTDSTAVPVAVTTGPAVAPVTIYNAAVSTGLGSIVIGGSATANPVGWWLNVPGNTQGGVYTSTIHLAIVTAP
jgi:hypothetical protein